MRHISICAQIQAVDDAHAVRVSLKPRIICICKVAVLRYELRVLHMLSEL
jgi:hypothetical protein